MKMRHASGIIMIMVVEDFPDSEPQGSGGVPLACAVLRLARPPQRASAAKSQLEVEAGKSDLLKAEAPAPLLLLLLATSSVTVPVPAAASTAARVPGPRTLLPAM